MTYGSLLAHNAGESLDVQHSAPAVRGTDSVAGNKL